MDMIYNWLLHNTGNEGNQYTILNSQRATTPEGVEYLRVMARLSDFTVLNLLIYMEPVHTSSTSGPVGVSGNAQQEHLTFSNQQQVIEYLSSGETAESPAPTGGEAIRVWVGKPAGDSGDITFPPNQP